MVDFLIVGGAKGVASETILTLLSCQPLLLMNGRGTRVWVGVV